MDEREFLDRAALAALQGLCANRSLVGLDISRTQDLRERLAELAWSIAWEMRRARVLPDRKP